MRNDELEKLLAGSGLLDDAISAAHFVDTAMEPRYRRRISSDLTKAALAELEIELSYQQYDVLWAAQEIDGVSGGPGATIADISAHIGIDAGKGSNRVGQMVRRGYLARGISQSDARHARISVAPTGQKLLDAVKAYRLLLLSEYIGSWTDLERRVFLPLFRRFTIEMASDMERSKAAQSEIHRLKELVSGH